MENNKPKKYKGDLLIRINNAIPVTTQLLIDNSLKNPEEHSEKVQNELNEVVKCPMTFEQMKEQIARLSESEAEEFIKQVPEVQKIATSMKTPLKTREVANIYRWLIRGQITLEILPLDVLEEFKQTRQYPVYIRTLK